MAAEPKGKRWIDGSHVDRKLTSDEAQAFMDRSATAWRFSRVQQGRRGKLVWTGPIPVHVYEVRDALVATKGQAVLLTNGRASFHGSTRHGDEWYFVTRELLDLTEIYALSPAPEHL